MNVEIGNYCHFFLQVTHIYLNMHNSIQHRLRKLIEDQNKDDQHILAELNSIVRDLELREKSLVPAKNALDVFSAHVNDFGVSGQKIATGIEDLDLRVPLVQGEYVVIGGRPAMGKTHLLINLALNISANVPVLYCSFDLSEGLLIKRMVSALSGLSLNQLMQGSLNRLEMQLFESVKLEFEKRNLWISDQPTKSLQVLRERCKKHVEEDGVKVVFIDYIQLISSDRYRHNREMEMSYVSRELKAIAREYNVLLIASSQLSRMVETRGGDKRPILSDLRESGSIEQDADKVFFLYRPEYYGFQLDEDGNVTDGITELILAKNRSGSLERLHYARDAHYSRIVSISEHLERFSIDRERLNELGDTPF
jgi:replicative DNA helicase